MKPKLILQEVEIKQLQYQAKFNLLIFAYGNPKGFEVSIIVLN